jgi:hypothetical protein
MGKCMGAPLGVGLVRNHGKSPKSGVARDWTGEERAQTTARVTEMLDC